MYFVNNCKILIDFMVQLDYQFLSCQKIVLSDIVKHVKSLIFLKLWKYVSTVYHICASVCIL